QPAFVRLPRAAAQYGSGGTPPIPPAAFAATSLCTREASLPWFIQPALVLLPSAAAVRCPDGQNSLCPGSYNRPSFDCRARQGSMGAASRCLTGGEGRG